MFNNYIPLLFQHCSLSSFFIGGPVNIELWASDRLSPPERKHNCNTLHCCSFVSTPYKRDNLSDMCNECSLKQ